MNEELTDLGLFIAILELCGVGWRGDVSQSTITVSYVWPNIPWSVKFHCGRIASVDSLCRFWV